MVYTKIYASPLGFLQLTADEIGLTAVDFLKQEYDKDVCTNMEEHPVLAETEKWLEVYFKGEDPGELPPLHLIGTTFQKQVWEELLKIPYGCLTTYGEIAARIAARNHKERMSAQAVGQAVGHNPVAILVPCHRVIGKNGTLTGYGGGMDKKEWMLQLEKSWKKTTN